MHDLSSVAALAKEDVARRFQQCAEGLSGGGAL